MPLAAFDRIQHALYGAVGHDDAWSDALRVIAETFDASFSMLVAAGQGQRDQSFYAAWNHPEEAARAYSDYWWQHDAWLQSGVAQGFFVQGNVMRGSDIVALPVFRQSRFYREYLAPLSAEYLLVSAVSDGSVPGLAPPSHLSLFRRPEQPDFDANDLVRMDLILPHVVRAFDLHWTTRRLQEQVTLLHRFLDTLDFGVLMLDPAARVLYANPSARALAAIAPRWLGSLPAHVAPHDPLAALVRACTHGQGGGVLGNGVGGAPGDAAAGLMALALPIEVQGAASGAAVQAQPGACMLVLARHAPAPAPASVPNFVARIFGLSPAETRLLPPLLRGSTPAEVATELGVKISTVRSQLSSIFAKTGATRQQDLIRLLGNVPPVHMRK
ncbi:helix-turn-helix transcriptional regulator [Comamonas humi]